MIMALPGWIAVTTPTLDTPTTSTLSLLHWYFPVPPVAYGVGGAGGKIIHVTQMYMYVHNG